MDRAIVGDVLRRHDGPMIDHDLEAAWGAVCDATAGRPVCRPAELSHRTQRVGPVRLRHAGAPQKRRQEPGSGQRSPTTRSASCARWPAACWRSPRDGRRS